MINKAMERKLKERTAVDVSGCERTPDGAYILKQFFEEMDYCDKRREVWIWSIGQHRQTGQILAATSNRFYLHPDFICLWLR